MITAVVSICTSPDLLTASYKSWQFQMLLCMAGYLNLGTHTPAGQWHDLVITQRHDSDGSVSAQQSSGVFVSNYIPLWVGLAPPNSQEALAALQAFKASVSALHNQGVQFRTALCIPASNIDNIIYSSHTFCSLS